MFGGCSHMNYLVWWKHGRKFGPFLMSADSAGRMLWLKLFKNNYVLLPISQILH